MRVGSLRDGGGVGQQGERVDPDRVRIGQWLPRVRRNQVADEGEVRLLAARHRATGVAVLRVLHARAAPSRAVVWIGNRCRPHSRHGTLPLAGATQITGDDVSRGTHILIDARLEHQTPVVTIRFTNSASAPPRMNRPTATPTIKSKIDTPRWLGRCEAVPRLRVTLLVGFSASVPGKFVT